MVSEFPIQKVRDDFPILKHHVRDKRLAYLDNGASTQKPQQVLDRLMHFYQNENANVHRGVHWLSEQATLAYEQARGTVAAFVGANAQYTLVFTRGTTESINLVAQTFGLTHIKAGDEIILSMMEHHANWVPWQQVAKQVGATLRVIPLLEDGSCDLLAYEDMLSEKTALLAITHTSNTLGTVNPISQMIKAAHAVGAKVLVDGAQALPHQQVDLTALDADFFVFSGHKMYAPMGIGALVAKKAILSELPPYQTGGGMIRTVTPEETTFANVPERFEAGTPNVAGAVGLAAACDYLSTLGMEAIHAHEKRLLAYAQSALSEVDGLTVHGQAEGKVAILSMALEGVHPHDLASILDSHGVAVRAGHHCNMPLMEWLQVSATLRASIGIYNDTDDIDAMVQGLLAAQSLFKRSS